MTTLAVDTEPMSAFESKKVFLCEFFVANIAVLSCALFYRFGYTINEVLVKSLNELGPFFVFLLLSRRRY